jgi:transposase
MTKYTEQFRLEVVQAFLDSDSISARDVARQYGLTSHSIVQRWVAAYQLHGKSGLSKKFSQYSAEFKFSVLQDMWDNQLSITQTAAKYQIRSQAMVGMWERAYRSGGFDALEPRPRRRPKTMASPVPKPKAPPEGDQRSREELLAELNDLRMEVAYLKKLRALVQAQQRSAPLKKRK